MSMAHDSRVPSSCEGTKSSDQGGLLFGLPRCRGHHRLHFVADERNEPKYNGQMTLAEKV
jgi:hypothetical protein